MTAEIDPNHPMLILLFFLEQEIDDDMRPEMRAFVEKLAEIKTWVHRPPAFVDEREEIENEAPIETLGGYIELLSEFPPWKVPRAVAFKELEDAEVLIAALCQFSREHGLVFGFEFSGDPVGYIDHGVVDDSLSETFIGEWRRSLEREA